MREQVFGSHVWRAAIRLGTYFGGKKLEMMKKAQVVQKAGARK